MGKKRSVKNKIVAMFLTVGIILACVVGYTVYIISERQTVARYIDMVFASANLAAAMIDGDRIDDYLLYGPDDTYFRTFELLQELKRANNLTFLYVVKPAPNHIDVIYVFDIYTEYSDYSLIFGLGYYTGEDDIDFDAVMMAYLEGQGTRYAIISDSIFGHLATAFVPLFASDGSVVAVVGADFSMDTILDSVRAQTIYIFGTVILIITASLMAILFMVQKWILNPVIELSNHMAGFNPEKGQLQDFSFSPKRVGDEFHTVSKGFNLMAGRIRLYAEKFAELDVAANIQKSMLPPMEPQPFADRKDFEIYASMHPAREVGGDFYDFFLIDNDTLAVVIADVSDKGIPAALFMAITKTLIKNYAQAGKAPWEVFETVNNMLCENNEANMFVTAFLGHLNLKTGHLVYTNAGHNPPLLKRMGGKYEFLDTEPSIVLAGFEKGISYNKEEIYLNAGDILYLYTDGVTEALNRKNEFFTDRRLYEKANQYKDKSVHELSALIKKEIDDFSDGAEQADDISMLALNFWGDKNKF